MKQYRWSNVDKTAIDSHYEKLKGTRFPKPRYNKKRVTKDIHSFAAYAANGSNLMNGDSVGRSFKGSTIIHPYHPHRWSERTTEDKSITEAWKDPYRLKRGIQLTIADGREPTRDNVARAFRQYKLGRVPAYFSPAQSLTVIRHYSKQGDTVLDPFMGYGGNIIAAATAKRKFIGIDLNKKSYKGNIRLAKDLSEALKTNPRNIKLHYGDSRTQLGKLKANSVDLVYTSPPYYNRELYRGKDQSHQIPSYDKWLSNFYTPIIKNTHRVVKPSGYAVINIAPVKESGVLKYPLDDDTVKIAERHGFKLVGKKKLVLGMVRAGAKGKSPEAQKYEPILVFKKKA